jgi:hypothetical protein
MRITSELIDHAEFHTGIWLQSTNRPGWYYFSKRKNFNKITNSAFAETVDAPLREIITFLHSKKIKTTPSCAGHLYPRKKLSLLYKNIAEEGDLIRTKGLYLSDVQNQKMYRFYNPEYSIPWRKDEFVEKMYHYQQKGIFGVRLNTKLKNTGLCELQIPGAKIYQRDNALFFAIEEKNNDSLWKAITEKIKRSLYAY